MFAAILFYSQGMAVLRLLRGFLGWDDFRRGLQNYVRGSKFKNAEMKDLWRTLSQVSLKANMYIVYLKLVIPFDFR